MRVSFVLLVGCVLPIAAGCAPARDELEAGFRSYRVDQPAELASALLFDPQPGAYDAQEFAQRSDWPSTLGFYSPGQVIYFSERIVDYQGRPWGFGGPPGTYRRADSYRAGVGYR